MDERMGGGENWFWMAIALLMSVLLGVAIAKLS
jgi:hypothetical protein